jgi:hypothetical protein
MAGASGIAELIVSTAGGHGQASIEKLIRLLPKITSVCIQPAKIMEPEFLKTQSAIERD